MPPSERDDMEVKDIQPWFDRAIDHKEKCENHRNQEIEKLSIENQQYPQFKREKMRNVLIDYENMNYHTFVLNLQKAKRSVPRRGNTRNDPFNPFVKDAAQKHQIRRESQERSRRPRYTKVTPKPRSPADIKSDLERKQANQLKQNLSRKQAMGKRKLSRDEKLDELRRLRGKSKELKKEAKSNPSANKSQSKKRKKAKPETAQEKKDRLKAKRDKRQAIKEVNERAANAEKEAKNAALSAKKGKKREYSRRTNLGPSRRRKGSGK